MCIYSVVAEVTGIILLCCGNHILYRNLQPSLHLHSIPSTKELRSLRVLALSTSRFNYSVYDRSSIDELEGLASRRVRTLELERARTGTRFRHLIGRNTIRQNYHQSLRDKVSEHSRLMPGRMTPPIESARLLDGSNLSNDHGLVFARHQPKISADTPRVSCVPIFW